MSEDANCETGTHFLSVKRGLEILAITWVVLLIASPFVGLTNVILYQRFLREHEVGFFEMPGWDLFWEFHSHGLGAVLFFLEHAPIVLALLVWGGVMLWLKVFDRA